MSTRRDDDAIVTIHCPRCGSPFLMRIEEIRGGYSVDVDTAGCYCALTDEEYLEMADRAVGVYETGEEER